MKKKKYSITPNQEEIAACAYHLWESEGCQSGRDLDYWLQAEALLQAKKKHESDLQDDKVNRAKKH